VKTLLLAAAFACITSTATAQRCPAGADAFGSCLPLDHRYGERNINAVLSVRDLALEWHRGQLRSQAIEV
jgi:hypothetical protein